jgi:hypothetical protein
MPQILGPSFRVAGIEPASVRSASTADRLAYWNAVLIFVLEAKDAELAAGLDRYGRPLASLKRSTIEHRHSDMGPADPHAPPLQPAHGLSRTRALLTGQATSSGVICWWKFDPHVEDSWGKILDYHRKGLGHLPKRDVIGLAPKSKARVAANANDWWKRYQRGEQPPVPAFRPQILPEPPPQFLINKVPAYKPKEPARAVPKAPVRISQIEVSGKTYTLQGSSAAQVRRMIANKTFSGFGRVTPLPGAGPAAPPVPVPGPIAPRPPRLQPAAPKPAVGTRAEKRIEVIERATAAPQVTHANPMIARAQEISARTGARTVIVDDQTQAIQIWGIGTDETPASYYPTSDIILINARSKYWTQKALNDAHLDRWFATSHPDQIIHHEIGHWRHRHAVGKERFLELNSNENPIGPAMKPQVLSEVSKYAATNKAEFIAEVHAGLMAEKTYSEKIMAYYKTLGGVIPE